MTSMSSSMSSETPDGVLVTFRDMYVELSRLTGELREVNTALRAYAIQVSDHESRIRSLERWRYALPASLIVALGSAIPGLAALLYH